MTIFVVTPPPLRSRRADLDSTMFEPIRMLCPHGPGTKRSFGREKRFEDVVKRFIHAESRTLEAPKAPFILPNFIIDHDVMTWSALEVGPRVAGAETSETGCAKVIGRLLRALRAFRKPCMEVQIVATGVTEVGQALFVAAALSSRVGRRMHGIPFQSGRRNR